MKLVDGREIGSGQVIRIDAFGRQRRQDALPDFRLAVMTGDVAERVAHTLFSPIRFIVKDRTFTRVRIAGKVRTVNARQ